MAEARYLFPGVSIQQVVGDSCVTLNTPDKFAPYLDSPRPGLVIAGAGCGHGAKGADEIGERRQTSQCGQTFFISGRIAAVLSLTGHWDCPLDRDLCRLRFKQIPSKI